MASLAETLVDRRLNNTAKTMAVLAYLGGSATTGEIIAAGTEHGARAIRSWNPGSLLSKAGARVTKLPTGWKLLPAGYGYLERQGALTAPLLQEEAADTSAMEGSPVYRVTICHGRSPLWREIKEFLRDNYKVEVQEFNSRTVVGLSTKERLLGLLDTTDIALILLTAEDEQLDGSRHPRLNVAHEVGLFQGRLGFESAASLLEDGCVEFSNISGVGQIRFAQGNVLAATESLRQYLKSRKLPERDQAA